MKYLFALLISIQANAESAFDRIADALEHQNQISVDEQRQESWDQAFCVENARYARTKLIPSCAKNYDASCAPILAEFYSRKCERWGL